MNTVFAVIKAKIKSADFPCIVGINGVDASGKTTFAKNFSWYLQKLGYKTQVINLDDFHQPKKIRNRHPDPLRSYFENAFDLKKLEKEILQRIKEKGELSITLDVLDLTTDRYTLTRQYDVYRETIVIIEGVLLYRDPIDQFFDLRIFLDVTFSEVIKRVKQRDIPIFGKGILEKYKTKYIPIQKRYIEVFDPIGRSDFVINNNDLKNPKIKITQ